LLSHGGDTALRLAEPPHSLRQLENDVQLPFPAEGVDRPGHGTVDGRFTRATRSGGIDPPQYENP
jgi:hypothetical protein